MLCAVLQNGFGCRDLLDSLVFEVFDVCFV